MRAMSAAGFNGYEDLKLIDLPKPEVSEGKVLVRMTGGIKPIVAKTFPLAEAADALRYLVEARPFGRVVLTI